MLYRLVERGSSPASDTMLREFLVEGPQKQYRPLGFWIIDSLQRAEVCQKYGERDHARAWKKQIKEIEEAEDRAAQKKEEYIEQIGADAARDAEKYVLNARKTYTAGTKPGLHGAHGGRNRKTRG